MGAVSSKCETANVRGIGDVRGAAVSEAPEALGQVGLLDALIRDRVQGADVSDGGVGGEVIGERDVLSRHARTNGLPEVLGLGRTAAEAVEKMTVLNPAEFVDSSI
jgi:hypothetical protein